MENKKNKKLTRREFMRDSTMAAAGLAVGLGATGSRNAFASESTRKTRSYNPDMEYRPLGKTGLWVSAVCLGGHWKGNPKVTDMDFHLTAHILPSPKESTASMPI